MSAWEPLASEDPVPGDPAALRAGAQQYAELVEHIGGATLRLRSFADRPLGQSAAVERVTDVAAATWDDVVALRERYEVAARELDGYARVLDQAQGDAARLRVHARTEDDVRQAAVVAARDSAAELVALAGEPGSPAYAAALEAHRAALDRGDAAARRIAMLRGQLTEVQDVVRAAGDRAAGAIRTAVRADGVRDSWFERVGLAVLEKISPVAGAISALAGTAALLLVWFPVAGQAAAALLATVALATGAVALGSDLVLQSHGRKTWGDVAWSAVGVVGGLAGRAAGKAARGFRATTRPTIQAAARRAAARPAGSVHRIPWQVPGRRGARLARRFGGDAFRRALPVRTHGARGAVARGVSSRTGAALSERRLMLLKLDRPARRLRLAGVDVDSARMYRALSYTAKREPDLAAAVQPQLRAFERAARLQAVSTATTVPQVPVTAYGLARR